MTPGLFSENPFCITMRDERMIDLREPSSNSIRFEDIVYSLSNLCRFGGHLEKFYSVAEHSVAVAHDALSRGCSVETCLAGLLHDSAEAYIGDISRPLKDMLGTGMKEIESKVEQAIQEAMGINFEEHRADIEISDNAITLREFELFRPDCVDLLVPSFDQVLKGYRTEWATPKFLEPSRAANLFWHSYDFLKMQTDV